MLQKRKLSKKSEILKYNIINRVLNYTVEEDHVRSEWKAADIFHLLRLLLFSRRTLCYCTPAAAEFIITVRRGRTK